MSVGGRGPEVFDAGTPAKTKAPAHRTSSEKKPVKRSNQVDVVAYLRDLFDPPDEWERAETAGQCLKRYSAVQDAWSLLSSMKVKQPSGGGWRLPDGKCRGC